MKNKNGPVLLVDDDPAYTYLLEEALNGCLQRPLVHVLHKGTELLAWLATNPRPCLILLDINLPLVNGFDLLALLKDKDPYKEIPVVMMTELGDRHSVVEAYKKGAAAYIIKPTGVEALQGRLELLSCFWQATDSFSGARRATIRQEFERQLSYYRRSAYEGLQRWQDEGRNSPFNDLPECSGKTHHPTWRLMN
ncbi:response regulator [Spirosoma pulveris]